MRSPTALLLVNFKNRKVKKTYLALVRGVVKSASGIIETSIGRHKTNRKKMTATINQGRQAETRYKVLETLGHFSYLQLFPKTGRTHQIRVHLASIHHPVLGDKLYGGLITGPYLMMPRQALHAHRIEINHPVNKQPLVFESPRTSRYKQLPGGISSKLEPITPYSRDTGENPIVYSYNHKLILFLVCK